MSHLTKEYIRFFEELQKNNNKGWFDENRKTYETEVKKPFYELVDELIERVKGFEPELDITASEAVMRINKDIRFSKDKTPYNLRSAAVISTTGRKDKSVPGMMLAIYADKIVVFGGAHDIERNRLQKLHTFMANNLERFYKLIGEPVFKKKFGEILGEKYKRASEHKELVEQHPILLNKQYYYKSTLPAKLITSDHLVHEIIEHWRVAKPIKDFLIQGLYE